MIYLIILENKSIFKLYDNFFENFYTCNDYTINDDVIILSSVIINFISKLSPKSGNLIRKKLLNYIIIQNLYLLASSYKLSNPDAITNEDIFITDLLELCEKAGSVLSSSNFDDINELILACLGKENKLFNEQVTKTLSNIVNYNYITYREYLATTEISMISKNILFERLKSPVITYDKPVENININIKKEEEKEPEKTEKSSSVFEVNIDTIQDLVADYYDVTVADLKSKSRKKELVYPRQVAMYFAKEFTNLSLKSIGYHFGGRDHSTVIHAIQTISDLMEQEDAVKEAVQKIRSNFS
jgi:hypothetical protein